MLNNAAKRGKMRYRRSWVKPIALTFLAATGTAAVALPKFPEQQATESFSRSYKPALGNVFHENSTPYKIEVVRNSYTCDTLNAAFLYGGHRASDSQFWAIRDEDKTPACTESLPWQKPALKFDIFGH